MGSDFGKKRVGGGAKPPVTVAGIIGAGQDAISVQTDILGESHFVQIDVFETTDEVVVELDIPGVTLADIKVSASNEYIMVEGMKKDMADGSVKVAYLCAERRFGPIKRMLKLPSPINPNNVRAYYKNGVLEIHAPRVPERRNMVRQISIQID